ncbi:RNA polymerase sporulation sigma factor SigK [Clostridia bacterium OttesenSCG-928-F22]|nr:RNA polymerase sporulation sigma factor SigK [Clostridia bacterium OttesenSCG-928-F22]
MFAGLTLIREFLVFALYLSNSKSFSKPLTQEEEKKYLEAYFAGDTSAKDVLIEKNMRLVAHISKKYSSAGVDNEDLISIGTIGLIKGVTTFKPNKGAVLATYCAKCIENEVLMHLRASKKLKNEVMLDDPIGLDKEGNSISLYDILGTSGELIEQEVETTILVDKMLQIMYDVLNAREQLVIELRYGLKNGEYMTQREIAQRLNISRSYISRIEKKALKKLKKALMEK